MQDYQTKYHQEKRKYDNLLKMQKTILTDNDQYIAAFNTIRQTLAALDGQSIEQQEITGEQAEALAQKVCQLVTKRPEQCQCQRWRSLYQQQCKEAARMSQQKQELMNKILAKQRDEELDRVQINKLLNDYLELYKKSLEFSQRTKSDSKKRSSKSRGKHSQYQTQRKPNKQNKQDQRDQHPHIKTVIQKIQKEASQLQQQVESLRILIIQKQQLLRLYRQKERKHLLSGGELLGI